MRQEASESKLGAIAARGDGKGSENRETGPLKLYPRGERLRIGICVWYGEEYGYARFSPGNTDSGPDITCHVGLTRAPFGPGIGHALAGRPGRSKGSTA